MTIIGNSGFEYILKNITTNKRQKKLQCTIRDIRTKEVIKSLNGSGKFNPRGGRAFGGSTPSYKFLGYDNYYYYIQITGGTIASWGQIQSDGAVLKSDRSILTVIPFFPNYKKPETKVPVSKPIVITQPPNIPVIVTVPKTTLSVKTATTVIPNTPPVNTLPVNEDISWIQKIINWIMKMIKG